MSMWRGVLINCGIDEALLVKKGTACPICGGQEKKNSDRFTFDDRTGKGDYYCRGCDRPGNGFDILKGAYNINFQEALKMAHDGGLPITRSTTNHVAIQQSNDEENKRKLYHTLEQCVPAAGTPAEAYLHNRGLSIPPPMSMNLQCFYAPAVVLFNKDTNREEHHHAMVWKMRSSEDLSVSGVPDGVEILHHKTLITEGGAKAVGNESKKYSERWINRGVELGATFAPITYFKSQNIILAEGIETTIAAYEMVRDVYGLQCSAYAFTNQGNMKKFAKKALPPYMQHKSFFIFADNDSKFTGQVAANTCAANIMNACDDGLVKVFTPPKAECDWADNWLYKLPAIDNIELFQ